MDPSPGQHKRTGPFFVHERASLPSLSFGESQPPVPVSWRFGKIAITCKATPKATWCIPGRSWVRTSRKFFSTHKPSTKVGTGGRRIIRGLTTQASKISLSGKLRKFITARRGNGKRSKVPIRFCFMQYSVRQPNLGGVAQVRIMRKPRWAQQRKPAAKC